MLIDKSRAAQMLCAGFVKGWNLRTVLSAATCKTAIGYINGEQINAQAPFLPSDGFRYDADVREYISVQWPKLANFLRQHSNEPQRIIDVATQVERLRYSPKHRASRHAPQETNERRRDRAAYRQSLASFALEAQRKKTLGRSAWGVCKP